MFTWLTKLDWRLGQLTKCWFLDWGLFSPLVTKLSRGLYLCQDIAGRTIYLALQRRRVHCRPSNDCAGRQQHDQHI